MGIWVLAVVDFLAAGAAAVRALVAAGLVPAFSVFQDVAGGAFIGVILLLALLNLAAAAFWVFLGIGLLRGQSWSRALHLVIAGLWLAGAVMAPFLYQAFLEQVGLMDARAEDSGLRDPDAQAMAEALRGPVFIAIVVAAVGALLQFAFLLGPAGAAHFAGPGRAVHRRPTWR